MDDEKDKPKFFQPPLPSRATRFPSLRSKASLRGTMVMLLPADDHPRCRVFESNLEKNTLYLLGARRDVHDIWDQPPAVKFLDADGKMRDHTFDFRVALTSGELVAIAVKPWARVVQTDFKTELAYVQAMMPLAFANRVILVTERSLDKTEVRNAAMFHEFRQHEDAEADKVVDAITADMTTPTAINDIVTQSGLGARAFRAIVNAIYRGRLSANRRAEINYAAVVTVEGAV